MSLRLTKFIIALGLCALPSSAFAWTPNPSQPGKAIFYPDEVAVTVEEKLAPEQLPNSNIGFLLAIPAGAKQDTFMLTVGGSSVGGYYWLSKEERDAALAKKRGQAIANYASIVENETSPERKALLEKVIPLQDEAASLEGSLAAVQSRITLWEKTLEKYGESAEETPKTAQNSPASEADKLDAAYAKQYPALYAEKAKLARAHTDVKRRLQQAEQALYNFDNSTSFELVAVPFAGEGKTQDVQYTYVVPGQSSLSYRIDALPNKKEVSIAQDATLSQYSGFAWTDVDVSISTLRRDRTLRPLDPRPWILSYIKKAVLNKAAPAPMAEMAMEDEAPLQASSVNVAARGGNLAYGAAEARKDRAPMAPTVTEKSTFRLWEAGKQRIEQDNAVRLSLATDAYPAEFLYTLRPMSNPKGFLTADIKVEKALELPPGLAQFSVDGAPIGRNNFAFNGTKGTIYFGTDPQVTATMRDLQKTGGEQGFFSKETTLTWHWEIVLTNSRSQDVAVVLEDPMPDPREESITIKASSTPQPEIVVNEKEKGGAKIYRWKLTLNPGKPMIVNHKVDVSAPADKMRELNPGRSM